MRIKSIFLRISILAVFAVSLISCKGGGDSGSGSGSSAESTRTYYGSFYGIEMSIRTDTANSDDNPKRAGYKFTLKTTSDGASIIDKLNSMWKQAGSTYSMKDYSSLNYSLSKTTTSSTVFKPSNGDKDLYLKYNSYLGNFDFSGTFGGRARISILEEMTTMPNGYDARSTTAFDTSTVTGKFFSGAVLYPGSSTSPEDFSTVVSSSYEFTIPSSLSSKLTGSIPNSAGTAISLDGLNLIYVASSTDIDIAKNHSTMFFKGTNSALVLVVSPDTKAVSFAFCPETACIQDLTGDVSGWFATGSNLKDLTKMIFGVFTRS